MKTRRYENKWLKAAEHLVIPISMLGVGRLLHEIMQTADVRLEISLGVWMVILCAFGISASMAIHRYRFSE